MTQPDANLDFSETLAQVNTIPRQPEPELLPQPLADWLARVLARMRATPAQPTSDEESK